MKYLDFEKHIKEELGNSKEPVQMDALLASLNLGNERPKKKGFAFWILIPFLLLIGSALAWTLIDDDGSRVGDNLSSQDQNSTIKSELVSTGDINNSNIEKSTLISPSSLTPNQSSESTLNIESTQSSAQLNTIAENQNQNRESNQKLIPDQKKATNESSAFKDISNNRQDKSFNFNTNQTTSASSLSESYLSQYETSTDKRAVSDSYPNKTERNSLTPSNNLIEEDEPNPSLEEEALAVRDLIAVQNLEQSIDLLQDQDIDGSLFSRMKINCPSFDNSHWHLALIPEVGIFKPFKTLENLSSDESAAFNERSNSESTLEGLEIGLYGMLVRDKVPFYLKAGVAYSRIAERMNLEYEYVESDTTVGIISTTVSGNGDTITHIYGDIVTETTYKGSNRQHHYIHLFDIPISVGYTTYIGGLDIAIEAGVRVNFMTRATGNLLVSQREYTNLSLNRLFKNRVGLSYSGGLMIGRNFGRFGDIFIAPRFTYFPNDFNNQNNNIRQRYFNIGINAGVVYKIN